MIRSTLVLLALLLAPLTAAARTVEPGAVLLGAYIGPGFRLGSTLGGSRAYFLIGAQGEYSFDKNLSAVGDLSVGLSGTLPLRLHLGARYRLSEIDLPLSPYVQAQVAVGELFNVIGANLTFLGLRLAAGADYFLTGDLGVGALIGLDMGSTTGSRPAFYGTIDVLFYATYALH